ncbi:MAG: hypothetical protein JSS12_08220, partial [Verrucomicrobia bacterium]|nr:hypothetical protein [Verrucomicrobiota bacterium]
RRYFDTFLKLLHPVPEGILGEVIPQIMDDKKLSPYFADILTALGCEHEKVVIEKLVQWLNSKPTKAGTLALVEKLPSEAIREDLASFTEDYGDDRTQMNLKFREILSKVGSDVFDKLFQERQRLVTS